MMLDELGQIGDFSEALTHHLAESARLLGDLLRHKVRETLMSNLIYRSDGLNDGRRECDLLGAIDEFGAVLAQDSEVVIFEIDQTRRVSSQGYGVRCYQTPVFAKTYYEGGNTFGCDEHSVIGVHHNDRVVAFYPLEDSLQCHRQALTAG